MKLVNGRKMVRSILLVVGIIIAFNMFVNNNVALSHKEVAYREIYTASGDTLWTLAKQEAKENLYYANKDVRYIIKDIQKVNNLSSSEISVGQKLIIPSI